jgi:transcriptional regulator with XRE-family HTH domain
MANYKRVHDLREDSDMKQWQIADLLYINRSTYSSYENGSRMIPPEILSKLADLFNTSVDFLMERTDVKTPYPKPKRSSVPVKYLDITGLTDKQIEHIKNFIEDLRSCNKD